MRTLVTGIAGFLGSHLADALIARGDQVIGIDDLSAGEASHVPRDARLILADCADLKRMQSAMRNVEIVYHCAATPHEGLSLFSPSVISKNIVGGSASVISAALSAGVRRLVFCSSMARYGIGEKPPPFREEMRPAPVDPYGIGKVAVEDMLRTLGPLHGLEYVIAVPHNILGPRQRYVDPFRNVAAIFANLMLQGRSPVIYGDGTQTRCFSYVGDCVSPLLEMSTRPVAGETINIGPDEEPISILDLAKEVATALEIKFAPVFAASRPCEVRHATCSSDKARRLLGYRTTTNARAAIRSVAEYVKQKGPRAFEYHLDVEVQNARTPKTWLRKTF